MNRNQSCCRWFYLRRVIIGDAANTAGDASRAISKSSLNTGKVDTSRTVLRLTETVTASENAAEVVMKIVRAAVCIGGDKIYRLRRENAR